MSRHHWDSQGFSTERVDSVRGGLIAVEGGVPEQKPGGQSGRGRGLQAAGGGGQVLGRSLERRGRRRGPETRVFPAPRSGLVQGGHLMSGVSPWTRWPRPRIRIPEQIPRGSLQ